MEKGPLFAAIDISAHFVSTLIIINHSFYRSGLLLTPYFYSALDAYEKSDDGIRDNFPAMARGIELKAEQQRFQGAFYKIPVPQKTVSRPEVPQAPPEPPRIPLEIF